MDVKFIIEDIDAPGIAELKVVLRRPQGERIKVSTTEEQVAILRKAFNDDNFDVQEEMIMMCIDLQENLLGTYRLSSGTISEVKVDMAKILRAAALLNAHGIIIAHNHPNHPVSPSNEDIKFTNAIGHCLAFAEFEFVDMIILTRDDHFSFYDTGLMAA